MFTGLIEQLGQLVKVEVRSSGQVLQIRTQFKNLSLGESIAVDGACLTVVKFLKNGLAEFEVSPETLSRTIARGYRVGSLVNLERSLKVGDRLGGHFVLGHVDEVVEVDSLEEHSGYIKCTLGGFSKAAKRWMVEKGSFALNGVSLTINRLSSKGRVEVMWIPHTLKLTNLSYVRKGSLLNVELDYLAKVVVNQRVQ